MSPEKVQGKYDGSEKFRLWGKGTQPKLSTFCALLKIINTFLKKKNYYLKANCLSTKKKKKKKTKKKKKKKTH